MKKLFVIGMAVAMLVLSSCAAKKCELCGEKKDGRTVEVEGEKAYLCNDCADGVEGIMALAKAFS